MEMPKKLSGELAGTGFDDFIRPKTARAYLHPDGASLQKDLRPMNVGQKTAVGRLMRVADAFAGHGTFSTNFAAKRHNRLLQSS